MKTLTPMETLKAATASWHDALEAHAQSKKIMQLTLTRADFERLIAFQYGLYQALEPQITPHLDEHWPALAYGETRQKREALSQDLAQLKLSPPAFDADADFIHSPYHALGAAYVLEGATLGGQVILRHLKQIPEIAQDSPFHYYGIYGDQVGPRWKTFQAVTNEALDTEEKCAAAVAGAVETFRLACHLCEALVSAPANP